MQEQKEIQLNVTVENTNLILSALSELPFKVSSNLISELLRQAQVQVQSPIQPEQPETRLGGFETADHV